MLAIERLRSKIKELETENAALRQRAETAEAEARELRVKVAAADVKGGSFPAAARPTSAPTGATWPFDVGALAVEIRDPKVKQVDFLKLGRQTKTQDPLFVVSVSMRNTSSDAKAGYKTLRGAMISSGRDFATLKDDLGNNYRRINFSVGDVLLGGVEDESVYPGRTVSDVLVFEPPIGAAKELILDIPLANFGGVGRKVITIPITAVGK
jgi:hypothetical protein